MLIFKKNKLQNLMYTIVVVKKILTSRFGGDGSCREEMRDGLSTADVGFSCIGRIGLFVMTGE